MPTLEWNVEKCLQKCRPALFFDRTIEQSKTRIRRARIIKLNEIQEAYEHLAKLISIYGDKYLPIFERLHSEISKRKSKNELLNIAKSIAHNNLSTEIKDRKRIENISHIFSHVSHTNIFR
tara:strand:- start:96 stop:458 length:363 start_codon:yes stop_codon:yes gene_type:complete